MLQGIFQCRKSRRLAQVEVNGEILDAYVSNGADMAFMQPGAICYLREVDNPKRSTAYDLYSVYDKRTLVCVDAKEPLTIAGKWYKKCLREELRSDDIFIIEDTKAMTLFCGRRGYSDNILVQVMGTSLTNDRFAYLPERQSSALNQRLNDILKMGYKGIDVRLLIVVCRKDADFFSVNAQADPYFARLFQAILDAELLVDCLRCKVTKDGMFADKLIAVDSL